MHEHPARMSMGFRAPILGVLGGMGPAATADFLARLARLTPADRDQDHIPTIVYSDPSTPDRSDSMLGNGPSPLPALVRGIEFLSAAGCSLIAIPCNGAHYWYDELAEVSTAPIANIIDATAERIAGLGGDTREVGIMATEGVCVSGLFRSRLEQRRLRAIDLTDLGDENPVTRGIKLAKAGRIAEAGQLLRLGAETLVERGAQVLIFGCTDISMALPAADTMHGVPVLDASDCLASSCISRLIGTTG